MVGVDGVTAVDGDSTTSGKVWDVRTSGVDGSDGLATEPAVPGCVCFFFLLA